MQVSCVRADMQIRPYQYVSVVSAQSIVQVPSKWFTEFNGSSGYVWAMTVLFQWFIHYYLGLTHDNFILV